MPEKVREFCSRTGQNVPETKPQIVRCIMESLALKYRMALEGLEEIVGYRIPVLHIVGGGCKNIMLSQFTANAISRPVITGPVEATAIGNLMTQLMALGEIKSLSEARGIIKKSFPTTKYLPTDNTDWDSAYEKFKKLLGSC
jgi:sugar (pentulose or hexulose) kinase